MGAFVGVYASPSTSSSEKSREGGIEKSAESLESVARISWIVSSGEMAGSDAGGAACSATAARWALKESFAASAAAPCRASERERSAPSVCVTLSSFVCEKDVSDEGSEEDARWKPTSDESADVSLASLSGVC